uniref:STAS domain-containing protein n=1 Tax=Leersia perrieri TaxID=77586 RepID=A0A0D9VPU7_9ORYZ
MGGGGGKSSPTSPAPRVPVPAPSPFFSTLGKNMKETFLPDDPFRVIRRENSSGRRILAAIRYVFPFADWAPSYSLPTLKSDLVAGITIASLAIPQGISYAKLANLPPILGLYSSFVPPLVYAMMGSSRDLAVGTVAVASLLIGSMLSEQISPVDDPGLYLHVGFYRGFSLACDHRWVHGWRGDGCLLATDEGHWRWESVVMGCGFLFFLLATRFFSKKRPSFFWVSAAAPLTSVIIGSVLKGLNPPSATSLNFSSPYMMLALKTGIITGVIALAEGIAVGRSFAMFKNYHIDGNKEMIAFGTMNIVGSLTSCYLTTGPFSRSAVNYNAGCKTAMSNVIMSVAVMITLLFLTPLFHYTPLVVLSAIIMSAMLGLIDYPAAIHLWQVDKVDFCVCLAAYLGVVFGSVEIGLVVAVGISILRVLLFMARPRTTMLGNIPNSMIYRRMDQYTTAQRVPGVLVLRIDSPIYFTNASYLRERIARWIDEEEDQCKEKGEMGVQYVVLDMGAVGSIDTSGTSMLDELRKTLDRRGLQIVLANPGSEIMKKLDSSKVLEAIGHEWIFPTVGEAVAECDYVLHSQKPGMVMDSAPHESMVFFYSFCIFHSNLKIPENSAQFLKKQFRCSCLHFFHKFTVVQVQSSEANNCLCQNFFKNR